MTQSKAPTGKSSSPGPAINPAAFRIAVTFLMLGAMWILVSDRVAAMLFSDPETLTAMQTWKGWVFVLATSAILYVMLDRELRGRRRAETALAQTQRMAALLVEQVQDHAIFAIDETGRIASWNAGSQATLGYPAEAALNQPVSTLFVDAPDAAPAFDAAAILAAGSATAETWCVQQGGTRIRVHVAFTAIRSPDGEHVGFSCVLRDLKERRLLDHAGPSA